MHAHLSARPPHPCGGEALRSRATVDCTVTRSLKLHLRDLDAGVVEAWQVQFRNLPNVEVSRGNILDLEADALVSPANSFGFMDGGIDLAYSQRFGWDLQARLRETLRTEHDGELSMGQALIVETYDAGLPLLVAAPTMRVPGDIRGTPNAYLAFRAALRAVKAHDQASEQRIRSLLCPGLGTAIGRLPPETAARQMFAAYAVVVLRMENAPLTLGQAVSEHHRLL